MSPGRVAARGRQSESRVEMVIPRSPLCSRHSLLTLLRIPFLTSHPFARCSDLTWKRCASRDLSTSSNESPKFHRAVLTPPSPGSFCGYLTDVEGNFEYFENYVEISRVLEWEDKSRAELKLKDDAFFVFGGDAQDKGAGDVRFIELMVALKSRFSN